MTTQDKPHSPGSNERERNTPLSLRVVAAITSLALSMYPIVTGCARVVGPRSEGYVAVACADGVKPVAEIEYGLGHTGADVYFSCVDEKNNVGGITPIGTRWLGNNPNSKAAKRTTGELTAAAHNADPASRVGIMAIRTSVNNAPISPVTGNGTGGVVTYSPFLDGTGGSLGMGSVRVGQLQPLGFPPHPNRILNVRVSTTPNN